jgi:glutaredoxin
VVQILDYLGVPYARCINVLESDDLRNGIKEFSNWPTIPQLYVKGEFVGGCDIITRDVPERRTEGHVCRKRHRSVPGQRDGLTPCKNQVAGVFDPRQLIATTSALYFCVRGETRKE